MTELNLIDRVGYGIHRMAQDQVRRFLPLPDYDLSTFGEVRLTIPGAVIDESYSQLLIVRTDLLLEDVLALDRVQKKLPISADATARLRKAKLIEGRKPHLHGAASVADAAGTRGVHPHPRIGRRFLFQADPRLPGEVRLGDPYGPGRSAPAATERRPEAHESEEPARSNTSRRPDRQRRDAPATSLGLG